MIIVKTVENGFTIHDEHPELVSKFCIPRTWVAPTIDELKDVVGKLAEEERKSKEKQK